MKKRRKEEWKEVRYLFFAWWTSRERERKDGLLPRILSLPATRCVVLKWWNRSVGEVKIVRFKKKN